MNNTLQQIEDLWLVDHSSETPVNYSHRQIVAIINDVSQGLRNIKDFPVYVRHACFDFLLYHEDKTSTEISTILGIDLSTCWKYKKIIDKVKPYELAESFLNPKGLFLEIATTYSTIKRSAIKKKDYTMLSDNLDKLLNRLQSLGWVHKEQMPLLNINISNNSEQQVVDIDRLPKILDYVREATIREAEIAD